MDTILTGTINESYKIFSKKKYLILTIISIVISIGITLLNSLANKSLGASIINNSSVSITVLNFMSTMIIPLFVIMITCDLFSGEISNNSIVMTLVRPISRSKLYLSKLTAVAFSTLIFLVITLIVSLFLSIPGGNINNIIRDIPNYLGSYLAFLLPMILVAIVAAFVSQLTKSGSMTVVVMILASFIITSLTIFFPGFAHLFPGNLLSLHEHFYNQYNLSNVINQFLSVISYGIIFMFAGMYIFEKRDM